MSLSRTQTNTWPAHGLSPWSAHCAMTGGRRIAASLALMLVCVAGAHAAEPAAVGSSAQLADNGPDRSKQWNDAPLFATDEPLAVTIRGPLAQLFGPRPDEPEQMAAQITAAGATVPVRLRQRGNFRRRASVCRIPPIRLNFRTRDAKGTVFAGQDKLKLVTHCRDTAAYEQNTLEEYLNYRVYGLLTPDSFRVRLLRITWEDETGKRKTTTNWGFLIESLEEVAHRQAATIPDVASVRPSQLLAPAQLDASLFQYLIANTDFSLVRGPKPDGCCHNSKLLQRRPGAFIPVPYDFDSAGSVNARYATPAESLGIRNVRRRLYRGYCVPEPAVLAAVGRYQEQRQAMLDLIAGFTPMQEKARAQMQKFLGAYFEVLDDPKQLRRKILDQCRI